MWYLFKWKTKPKPPQKPLFQSYISGFLWYRKMHSYCEQFGNFGKIMWPCWLLRSVFKSLWKEYIQYSQHIWNERSKCRTSYTELVTSIVLSDFSIAILPYTRIPSLIPIFWHLTQCYRIIILIEASVLQTW